MEFLTSAVHYAVEAIVILLDVISVILMLNAAVQTLRRLLKKEHDLALFLSRRISMALNFMLCGAVLQLILVHTITEVVVVAAVLLVHCGVSVFVHWEIKHHEKKATIIDLSKNYEENDDDDDDAITRIG